MPCQHILISGRCRHYLQRLKAAEGCISWEPAARMRRCATTFIVLAVQANWMPHIFPQTLLACLSSSNASPEESFAQKAEQNSYLDDVEKARHLMQFFERGGGEDFLQCYRLGGSRSWLSKMKRFCSRFARDSQNRQICLEETHRLHRQNMVIPKETYYSMTIGEWCKHMRQWLEHLFVTSPPHGCVFNQLRLQSYKYSIRMSLGEVQQYEKILTSFFPEADALTLSLILLRLTTRPCEATLARGQVRIPSNNGFFSLKAEDARIGALATDLMQLYFSPSETCLEDYPSGNCLLLRSYVLEEFEKKEEPRDQSSQIFRHEVTNVLNTIKVQLLGTVRLGMKLSGLGYGILGFLAKSPTMAKLFARFSTFLNTLLAGTAEMKSHFSASTHDQWLTFHKAKTAFICYVEAKVTCLTGREGLGQVAVQLARKLIEDQLQVTYNLPSTSASEEEDDEEEKGEDPLIGISAKVPLVQQHSSFLQVKLLHSQWLRPVNKSTLLTIALFGIGIGATVLTAAFWGVPGIPFAAAVALLAYLGFLCVFMREIVWRVINSRMKKEAELSHV